MNPGSYHSRNINAAKPRTSFSQMKKYQNDKLSKTPLVAKPGSPQRRIYQPEKFWSFRRLTHLFGIISILVVSFFAIKSIIKTFQLEEAKMIENHIMESNRYMRIEENALSIHLSDANYCYQKGLYRDALKQYQFIVEKYPKNREALQRITLIEEILFCQS